MFLQRETQNEKVLFLSKILLKIHEFYSLGTGRPRIVTGLV
ncbi:hypothetical protein Pint_05070 [Pistacia integerrima]|uniref:Uncharacterized protein n=1 Tax=Pistacia integerrima TaxID=434235 RepID=A0ACC0YZI7_9ROSI|nr:hypothetical protein Pint_05070 [Pistacia integerrima]